MVDKIKVCSDTGPILHLNEINQIFLLKLFSKIFISDYVREELLRYEVKVLPKNIELKEVNKDQVGLLVEKYGLDISECSVIWLCKSLKISLLLTDDLNARDVAKYLEIEPVGTIGIIIRCFREKIIDKKKAIGLLKKVYEDSSLFITSELINYAIKEVEKFGG